MIQVDIVGDGYDLDGFIAGQPGVYEDLNFIYRPITPIEERKLAAIRNAIVLDKSLSTEDKEVQCELELVKLITEKIAWWDLIDPKKKEKIPISVGAVVGYFPGVRYERLHQIVRDGLESDRRDGKPSATDLRELEKNSQPA